MEELAVDAKIKESDSVAKRHYKVISSIGVLAKPLKQYLYFAFRRSLRDAESYEDAARGYHIDDKSRSFLNEMSARKTKEARGLYEIYKEDSFRMVAGLKKRSIIAQPHYLIDKDSDNISSVSESFLFALKRERRNFDLYSKLTDLDRNQSIKRVFMYLSGIQMSHIVFIKGKIADCENIASDTMHSLNSSHLSLYKG